jgi:hypothetical protein
MARKDIHRPSAIEPEDYQFVAFDYLPSSPGDIGAAMFLAEERKAKRAHMERTGGKYSGHEHGGLCHVCGSVNAIYSASFYHEKSNSYIMTGLDCAEKLQCEGIEAFRKKVRAAKEANAGKRKAAAILGEAGLGKAWELYEVDVAYRKEFAALNKAWQEANPEPEYRSSDGGYGIETVGAPKFKEYSREEVTALDIVSRLIKWGNISEKAQNYLGVLLDKIERAPEIAAEKAAAKALENANNKPVPVVEGRVTVTGEVLSLKEQESMYGIVTKMLVKNADGWKVWGTVPAAIMGEVERGSVVEFAAKVQKSDKDEFFGFFSRPSKAKVIKALAA